VLAAGRGEIGTVFVSMARRHPDGCDAEYLRWHTLDHRPEQHRLAGVRASLRLASTPECRAARAYSDQRFDEIDHVMSYFFTDPSGLKGFLDLSSALGGADRKLPLLPPVQRGVYAIDHKVAAPRIKIGADVLPWWPAQGVYLLLESGTTESADLVGVDGVGGVWSVVSQDVDQRLASAPAGQLLTYVFLDDIPLRPPKGCGRCSPPAGNVAARNRCSPLPSIRSSPISGIAMCRRGLGCASV
jgi:hypothetical protein